jgi:hypothetical protein
MNRAYFLVFLVLLMPLVVAQAAPVVVGQNSGVETAQFIKEVKEGNAKVLQEFASVEKEIVDVVNANNDANMQFIDGLFKKYVTDQKKSLIVGILGAALSFSAIIGLINQRLTKKQYFVSTFKKKIEEQEIVIKQQMQELKEMKGKMADLEKRAPVPPQQYPQYQPQYQYPQPNYYNPQPNYYNQYQSFGGQK